MASATTTSAISITINPNPSPLRTSATKEINLVDLLPVHLEYSETGEFVQFFEDFLNKLYEEYNSYRTENLTFTTNSSGEETFFQSSADSEGDLVLVDSGVSGTSGVPFRYQIQEFPRISILEKIKRLADLHDPDRIDIDYINRLANLLGYDVGLIRSDVESISNDLEDSDVQRYLRFIVSNLPSWYRIKSTRNAVKILLYSFGLVGDILYRWTSDQLESSTLHPTSGGYGNDLDLWTTEQENIFFGITNPVSAIPSNYFPTPHFKIVVNVTGSPPEWTNNIGKVVDAVEQIKPINNVLEQVSLLLYDTFPAVDVRMEDFNRSVLFIESSASMGILNFDEIQDVTSGSEELVDITSAGDTIQDVTAISM